jgi:hypothetical protein
MNEDTRRRPAARWRETLDVGDLWATGLVEIDGRPMAVAVGIPPDRSAARAAYLDAPELIPLGTLEAWHTCDDDWHGWPAGDAEDALARLRANIGPLWAVALSAILRRAGRGERD